MSDTAIAQPFLTPKRMEILRDYVPFIAIALVILLFWTISGDRFMSTRNWIFIAQQTPVLMLLAFAQLMIVTTGSILIFRSDRVWRSRPSWELWEWSGSAMSG